MKRYEALDILRGLTIFGMVFSAIIPSGVLPVWMYHMQNPPPTHELNTLVRGISWVDLVFPIFIFCMGAAIPLSGRKKLSLWKSENITEGNMTKKFFLNSLERFFMLWIFSYLYVFMLFTNINSIWAQVLTLVGFAAFFPMYMVLKKDISNRRKMAIRLFGVVIILAVCITGHFCFDEVISVQRRGIIIFLLAFLYLFGSIIWYFTKDKPILRSIIFTIILLFTIISQQLNWPEITYANSSVKWWFNLEYIYFLLLLLPATYIGDILYKRIEEGKSDLLVSAPKKERITAFFLFPVLLATIIWLISSSATGFIETDILVVFCILIVLANFSILLPSYRKYFWVIILLLVLGFIFEPFTGYIKKVPCTISYCLITCAISIMLLIMIDVLCHITIKNAFKWVFAGAGKNPLMSYIAFSSLIVPLMNITGFITIYKECRPASNPWIGVLTSAVMVLITMTFVSFLSSKKIFWKA
ncbi:MAG: DUF5009 domain-containing protein [Bacteroidales bacterium]|nr:DUF5009 domain-containing protein [Bacteroidales bacterium]